MQANTRLHGTTSFSQMKIELDLTRKKRCSNLLSASKLTNQSIGFRKRYIRNCLQNENKYTTICSVHAVFRRFTKLPRKLEQSCSKMTDCIGLLLVICYPQQLRVFFKMYTKSKHPTARDLASETT